MSPDTTPTAGSPDDALVCPSCGERYPAGRRFCATDGTPLVPAAPAGDDPLAYLDSLLGPPSDPSPSDVASEGWPDDPALGAPGDAWPDAPESYEDSAWASPPAEHAEPEAPAYGTSAPPSRRSGARAKRSPLVVVAVVAVLVVAAAAVASTHLLGARQLERQALGAIARGDLVAPARVSAYDYYQRLGAKSGTRAAQTRVVEAAFPALIAASDRVLDAWYRTAEAPDPGAWPRVARMTAWADSIAGGTDPHVRARHLYAEGRIAHDAERWADAEAAYAASAAAWPEWALPYNSLGVVFARQERFDEAIAHYRTAAARDARWAFPHANLGSLHLRQRRYGPAADALRRAVALAPERAQPHAQLAYAYAGLGRYADALAEANEALRLDPYGRSIQNPDALRRSAEQWQVHSWYEGY